MAAEFSRRTLMQAAALAGVGCATVPAVSARRPNVVLIMTDDMGYGDLGCYGGEHVSTPHIDGLAARGIRFTDYHSNGAVCSPTRAALLTGRYQQRCGVDGVILADGERHLGMPLEELTIAEVLADGGYATGIAGKWHLGYEPKFGPNAQGFESFRGFVSGNIDYISHLDRMGIADWWENDALVAEEGYLTDLIGEHAVAFIEQHAHEPFFLYVPHGAPHTPLQARGDAAIRSEGVAGGEGGTPDRYPRMIEAVDDSVGRIVAALDAQGVADNTLVIFCSDNGPSKVGSAGALSGRKGSLWEGGHRVPCIAAWPGVITGGTESDETFMSMDFFPTVAAIAGATLPEGHVLDGVNIEQVLRGDSIPERPLFWKYGKKRAMREGSWKYLREGKHEGLYNLDEDPAEKHNRAMDMEVQFRRMRNETDAWYQKIEQGVPFLT